MTSRLCVKNIGKGTTEEKIRSIFSAKGEITDVKIIKTKSGKSREFAFVGFRNEQQANAAQQYFNNSYIGTSKIQIESAQKLTSIENIENPESLRSRHSKKKLDAYNKSKEKQLKLDAAAETKARTAKVSAASVKMSAEMQEFQSVMSHKRAGAVWDNDTAPLPANDVDAEVPARHRSKSDSDSDSDDDDRNDMVISGKDEDDEGSDNDSDNDSESEGEGERGGKVRAKTGAAFDSAVSDLDFLKSKVSKRLDSDDESENESDSDRNHGNDCDSESDEENVDSSSCDDEDTKEVVVVRSDGNDDGDGEETDEGADSGRLFVRNIPYTCDEEELRTLFQPYGVVTEVHIPINKHARTRGQGLDEAGGDQGASEMDIPPTTTLDESTDANKLLRYNKGFGFVQFMFPESASQALAAVDGTSFQGRLLHIVMAAHRVESEPEPTEGGRDRQQERQGHLSSYQKKLEADRKKLMNKVEGWNSSYVRADSAVDSLAKSFGVKSSDIMDTETKTAGEIAVAMAVSENQIIQENKDFFAGHSIDLSALESNTSSSRAAARSSTALLVKNLKYGTADKDELENMFAKFGPIAHFLMPPNRSVAYIEYVEATTARNAFKHMAYKRYHNMPLYLEWAPVRTSTNSSNGGTGNKTKVGKMATDTISDKGKSSARNVTGMTDNNSNLLEFGTIYLKNLNFQSSAEDIKGLLLNTLRCCKSSDIRGIVIPTKPAGSSSGGGGTNTALSMGYGFVEVSSVGLAELILKQLDGAVLDGHKLEAKLSEKRLSGPASGKRDKNSALAREGATDQLNKQVSSKLVIRNLAFQTSVEELKKLCSVYGNIKTIRLPKKGVNASNSTINQHRGFAFVEYHSKKEAELAYNQLKFIHLYGRHLVCEYASSGNMNDVSLNSIGTSTGANASSLLGDKGLKSLREKVKQDMKAINYSKGQSSKRKSMDDGEGGGSGMDYAAPPGAKRTNTGDGFLD